LRIAGHDCFNFMQKLANDFDIDFVGYDWSKYHRSEGEEMDVIWPIRLAEHRGPRSGQTADADQRSAS
jgi:hypothetical protein